MSNSFEKIMSEKSDSELIEILKIQRNDYRQEAIEAAEAEFRKRNISEELIVEVKAKDEEKQAERTGMAEEPLDSFWKVVAFLFPGLLLFMFVKKYEVEGYTRKSKELSRYTIYGFCFYGSLVLLASLG